ncbi:MAG: o-succinylbenzoate synthase [Cyanobacteria bacterium]|nr:o-succinylbenzoate synthase [Cyanobacteriota bacterium]
MSSPLTAPLTLEWRPFRFALPRALVTAQGALQERAGWLLRLQSSDGRLGWGEAAPLELAEGRRGGAAAACADTLEACSATIAKLGPSLSRQQLEEALPMLPGSLVFAVGAALAELEGLAGETAGGGLAAGWLAEGWLPAPPSAWLLPAGASVLPALEEALASNAQTLKWKVAAADDALERQLLEAVLERLPEGTRLRLDANGGWDRATATAWADRLEEEPRLEWLEQPLADDDLEGLEALVARLPVALDESLRRHPWLRQRWRGWQVRRPALEGDPRPLLAALAAGRAGWMVSTAFETGVGRRLVEHAAALQWRGPTPTAPGLAPQWRPTGPLFDADPAFAWASLEVGP